VAWESTGVVSPFQCARELGRPAHRDLRVASGPHALVEGAGVEIAGGDELDALGRAATGPRRDALHGHGLIAIRPRGALGLVSLPFGLGPPRTAPSGRRSRRPRYREPAGSAPERAAWP